MLLDFFCVVAERDIVFDNLINKQSGGINIILVLSRREIIEVFHFNLKYARYLFNKKIRMCSSG